MKGEGEGWGGGVGRKSEVKYFAELFGRKLSKAAYKPSTTHGKKYVMSFVGELEISGDGGGETFCCKHRITNYATSKQSLIN